jgi:hypothetical protein
MKPHGSGDPGGVVTMLIPKRHHLSVSFLQLAQALFQMRRINLQMACALGVRFQFVSEIPLEGFHFPLFRAMSAPVVGDDMPRDASEPRQVRLIARISPDAPMHLDDDLLRHLLDVLGRYSQEMEEREQVAMQATDQLLESLPVPYGGPERQFPEPSVIHPEDPSLQKREV